MTNRLGKPCTVEPLVGLCAGSSLGVGEAVAAAADDALVGRRVGDMEAAGNDDRVDLTRGAIGGDYSVWPYRGDVIGDDVDVRLRQRRVVGVRHQEALSADPPARGDPGAQPGIGDRALDVVNGEFCTGTSILGA